MIVVLNDNDMSISENVGALNNYLAKLMSGRFYAATKKTAEKVLSATPHGEGARQALRGTCQGHDHALDHVRGIRLQLHRPHRRPQPRRAGRNAHQREAPRGAAVPARGDAQGPGLQARRGRSHRLPRAGQVRSGRGHREGQAGAGRAPEAHLHAGLRRVAVRHGAGRQAPGRHHARDARRLGAGQVFAGVSRSLLRCRHRGAARGHVRGGARGRRA